MEKQIGQPFHLYFAICGFLLFQSVLVTSGLKMGNVVVPEFGLYGGSITLRCDFQLESDQLRSLSWYKNENEFYRYLPHEMDHVVTYPQPGFIVQKNNASLHQVTIRNLSLAATGIYKCEITADTTFQTLFRERNFTVIVPPESESPRINNISSAVLMGDTISGNCTSFRTRPPAQLTFHINEEKVEDGVLTHYRPTSEDLVRNGEKMQLFTSRLGLGIQVSDRHFRQGIISLKCVATVGHKRWVTEKRIGHKNFLSLHSSSQHNGSSMLRRKGNSGNQLLLLLMISLASFPFLPQVS